MEPVGCQTRIPGLKKSGVFCGTPLSLRIAQSISPKPVRTPACDSTACNSSPTSDISLPCHVSRTRLPFLVPTIGSLPRPFRASTLPVPPRVPYITVEYKVWRGVMEYRSYLTLTSEIYPCRSSQYVHTIPLYLIMPHRQHPS